MGTRATYSFGLDAQVTLYNHYDNYPEGAIHFIWAAFQHAGRATLHAEDFIRANDRFEITTNHAAHGDTEFRYYFAGTSLRVDKRVNYSDKWSTIHDGPWWEFVEHYKDNEQFPLEDYEPLVMFSGERYTKPYPATATMLKSKRDEVAKTLGVWASNGNDKGANWDSYVSQMQAINQALKELGHAPY